MPKITTTPLLETTYLDAVKPTFCTLEQLIRMEPALTSGGVRHLLFTKGHSIPGVYRFGRKILFDRAEFMAGIKAGHATHIAGAKK
ncbi:MAG: hypothetical protein B7X29_00095 [Halothiobacillus sp. 13-55-115]|jgi:hypothetical protein|nr:MAG: hypothetical protein B7X29_00095 [Halothiobacillus sp. 13-55-115]